ncbi:MAG: ImmA/IrrE family metallo-endopeptidase [Candidatus Hydrogenedentales bacterium]|jgi:HTH-type transcriptional regulator/antitoxin HigA
MKPKIIKTQNEYSAALARIEEIFDALPNTSEGDELELLAFLVEQYESKEFPIDLPDPLAAIRFRMEQKGLKSKDLVPYIGSPSKVSEVLSGRRTLSLTMIRNLSEGLGISAEVLLRKPGASLDSNALSLYAAKFPVAEMAKRGWFSGFRGSVREAREQLEDLIAAFVAPLGQDALSPMLSRQHVRTGTKMDEYALTAWRIRVMAVAAREDVPRYAEGSVTREFLRDMVRLSYLEEGPRLAREFLRKNGIHVVVEPHLPRTYLDGAALRLPNGAPVVALTLRHDRLDNFWFTLAHELAHVALHLDTGKVDAFFDDFDGRAADKFEREADVFASDALISSREWKESGLSRSHSESQVKALAERLRISPAIPAGRIRFERNDYRLLGNLVGKKRVRCLFTTAGEK